MKWSSAIVALFAILSFGISIVSLIITIHAENESHKQIIVLPPHLQQLIDTSLRVQEHQLHQDKK
jgi:hypothetical protein